MAYPVNFGDIIIPFLTSKDTSIDRNVTEKNFVDSPPQVFELNSNLEAGTYSAILNESIHPRNESFEEQMDAVQSMPARHVTEFPFEVGGDRGHIMVNSATSTISPSLETRESEIDIRFFEQETYRPGAVVSSFAFDDSYSPSPVESVYPVPSTAQNVVDGNGNSLSPTYTVYGEDGSLDLYPYSGKTTIEFDRPADYSSGEQINPVRVYNSEGERIYSDSKILDVGSQIDNGLIRATYNDTSTNLEFFDESWGNIGSFNASASKGYCVDNTNYEVNADFITGCTTEVWRGFPVVRFDVSGGTSYSVTSSSSFTTVDSSTNWYRVVEDSNDQQIVFVRTTTDGSFTTDSSSVGVDSLFETKNYTFFVGIVPREEDSVGNGYTVNYSDFARYIYNRGSWKRTLVQR